MSDKRGDADIEDVLSSVLRLVSEDLRVPGRVQAPAKLLLTPDQRVSSPAAPEPSSGDLPPDHLPTAAIIAAPASRPDDAALRDLIREVLREELHGPLGERITRSVRKLVRAEVNRLTATRDID